MAERLTILVSGAIANRHVNGGGAWVRLNWVLGLRWLGCAVHFVEQIRSDACVDDTGTPAPFERSANLHYFQDIVRRFAMEETTSLVRDEGAKVYGVPYSDVLQIAAKTDVLINISGHLTLAPIFERVRCKAYDRPRSGLHAILAGAGHSGRTARRSATSISRLARTSQTSECPIPMCGLPWKPAARFVVLDQWPVCTAGNYNRFDGWRLARPVWPGGPRRPHVWPQGSRVQKVHAAAFTGATDVRDRYEYLPGRSRRPRGPQAQRLAHHRQPRRGRAGDPLAFRRYVQESGSEFSAAQDVRGHAVRMGERSDRGVSRVRQAGAGPGYRLQPQLIPSVTGLSHSARSTRRSPAPRPSPGIIRGTRGQPAGWRKPTSILIMCL